MTELKVDRTSASYKLARQLTRADHQLLVRLIQTRVDRGISQAEIARRMGVSQPSVAAFERYDNDPKLSTIRRYAHALGVRIGHIVDDQPVTTWRSAHPQALTSPVTILEAAASRTLDVSDFAKAA
jgi:transcriptional regulator with XRE-family HTH domain